ncbi:MAG: PEP-CTERM sorting domain-containing protein [Trichocoleus desertorum ATA4-8-CV12]|jgi:hypothetical protein|nr:PEP-CTERM sorting domain-containing protein [Trichocoleus desertorum ATA4-8-CV12]
MNFRKSLVAAAVTASTVTIAASSAPAQAFSFTTQFTGTPPTKDIILTSVKFNGQKVTDFSLVSRAQILQNDPYTRGNSGAASSDIGDKASGTKQESATNDSIVASLGNLNLNNIIDTEDKGSFKINLFFEKAVDTLFLWERGMNSKLGLQAINSAGTLIGNFLEVDSSTFVNASYSIDTKEIGEAQNVGSLGLNLSDLGVGTSAIAGVQLVSKSSYNGPDFKIVGATVPEPSTMAGLGLAAGAFLTTRRRKAGRAS